MRRYTDFIYRNAKDTIRIRIWKRTDEAGHWGQHGWKDINFFRWLWLQLEE